MHECVTIDLRIASHSCQLSFPPVSGNVDKVLNEDDKNHDGYLSYVEFKVSRRAAKLIQENT